LVLPCVIMKLFYFYLSVTSRLQHVMYDYNKLNHYSIFRIGKSSRRTTEILKLLTQRHTIGSISPVLRGDARKMIQSINRFSPALCGLSQYVSLIMSLQCYTDPVIFYFQKIKMVRSYTEHGVYKFKYREGQKKHLVCISWSEYSMYYVIDFYKTLGNLTGTYKGPKHFHAYTSDTQQVWIYLTVMRFQMYIWECSDGFFSPKLIFLN